MTKKPRTLADLVISPDATTIWHYVREAATFGIVLLLFAVVLLPLVWMVITSFKRTGLAFSLNFVPSTVVYTPAKTQGGAPIGSDAAAASDLPVLVYHD
ncbi:MAG TPA: hypothetical protein PKD58_12625, partial [Candidatus Sumerlaeota bacterium]|nr:hypothetical protein [Candidatus Sumerlaeota bacterium]